MGLREQRLLAVSTTHSVVSGLLRAANPPPPSSVAPPAGIAASGVHPPATLAIALG
jgi:hypothetical protein